MESKTEQHIANWGVVWKSQIKPPREHKGRFPPLSFCVLALSVRRNAAVALPCRKRLRTQKTVFFSPPFPLVESRHFPYSVVGIRPQPVNQIWFLRIFFLESRISSIQHHWEKGQKPSITRSPRKERRETTMKGLHLRTRAQTTPFALLKLAR